MKPGTIVYIKGAPHKGVGTVIRIKGEQITCASTLQQVGVPVQ